MKRYDFFKHSAIGLSGFASTTQNILANPNEELDQYGGIKSIKFKATGYFRVEKSDRWWLVTPEGHAFLSFGINHLNSSLFNREYNSPAWQKKLKLEKLYGHQFNQALRGWFLDTCHQYGFNTSGVHTNLHILNQPKSVMPYMQPIHFVDIPHWKIVIPDSNFVDVFSDSFKQHCDQLAKKIALPIKDDPFVLGYSMTDCTLFTEEDCRVRPDVIGGARRTARVTWPRRLRNFGGNAAGKKAYVNCMRELYRDQISEFNKTYDTRFQSFSELQQAEKWRPDADLSNGYETRDNIEFLKKIVHQYYRTAKESIRRYDKNHMFFGDKINGNTDSVDTVLPVTSQYTDVVLYQMYAKYEVQQPCLDKWTKMVDQPFINGDSAYTMVTDTMPRPYGPVADNLEQRAEWTDEFFLKAFSRQDFVGWHYCGLIDATNQNPKKVDRQHSGLLNSFGEPYSKLEKVMKTRAQQMYSIATGKVSS